MKPLLAAALLLASASLCAGGEIPLTDAIIDLQFPNGVSAEWQEAATGWMKRSASAVSSYYGKFPVRRATLRIKHIDGREPKGGMAYGYNGPLITISLGRHATDANVADDWLLVHEMLHFAFPDLAERHLWLEEGLATYVEPVARARAGLLTPARAWGDLVDGLPQGQPESGDEGLDVTHTWGRTYWGGALFCLRADVEIRRRTENRRGLEHALRAIVAAGGTIETHWEIDRVIATADRATGVPVFRELYEEMKVKPVRVDLESMWRELGVRKRARAVIFDDAAPLAAVRKAIMGE